MNNLANTIPKTHIKALRMFAMWMRDNGVCYCMQTISGGMFEIDGKVYNVEELLSLYIEHGDV